MTWKELKEFCNNLPENELEKKVIVFNEEEVIHPIEAMQLAEDHYRDEDSELCMCETDAKSIADDEDEYPNGIDDMIKVYDKGHPVLWVDF